MFRSVCVSMLLFALFLLQLGCETGFGEPCTIPQTPSFQSACSPPAAVERDGGVGSEVNNKASCAITNYVACETRVCLVYRNSDPFCSMDCQSDGDCEGSGKCCPLFGECDVSACADSACYCVRQQDRQR